MNVLHKAIIPDGNNPSYQFKRRLDLLEIKKMLPAEIKYYKNFVIINGITYNGIRKEDIDALLCEDKVSQRDRPDN